MTPSTRFACWGHLVLSLLFVAAIAAGPACSAAEACAPRADCCCCPQQEAARPHCAIGCAEPYAGTARWEAGPLRITSAPLRKPLKGLCALPLSQTPPAIRISIRSLQRCQRAGTPPKRYLLACTLRL